MSTAIVICVAPVTVDVTTVGGAPPGLAPPGANVTVAPFAKPAPVIVSSAPLLPLACEAGPIPVIVGPAFTVNAPAPVALPPSGLVTVTSRGPIGADAEIV